MSSEMLFLKEKNEQSELHHLYTDCGAELVKINVPGLYSDKTALVSILFFGIPVHRRRYRTNLKPYAANYLYV